MKKSTKGAFAAGTAAVLLLGGAGTLASWNDSSVVNGGAISTGSLDLSAGTCDANWVYAAGNASAGTAITKIVPGDKITKSCTFTVTAVGDNIKASVTAPSSVTYSKAAGSTATTDQLTVATTYTLDGTPLSSGAVITKAANTKSLVATFTVTMPFGNATTINANDTQNLTATLDALTVSLQQVA